MELRISEKKFVCVDYPGIVQNQDAMLQTLGGTAEVTKVIPRICLRCVGLPNYRRLPQTNVFSY